MPIKMTHILRLVVSCLLTHMCRIWHFDNYLSLGHGSSHIDGIIPFADCDWLSMEAAILMTSYHFLFVARSSLFLRNHTELAG